MKGKVNRADLSRRSLDEVGSSIERRRVKAAAQFHFVTPQLAAGSFILEEAHL
jgi:hypothetical protein